MSRQRNNEEKRSIPITLWATFIIITAFFTWASMSEIQQVTRAQGSVIPSSRIQVIQSLDGGVLTEMPVQEGDSVNKGDLLAKLDPTKPEAGYLEAEAKVVALTAARARLEAEITGAPLTFPNEVNKYPQYKLNQRSLMIKRQTAINEDITTLQAMKALATKELEMTQPLLKSGDVSLADVLRLQRQVAEIQSQITNKMNKYLQDTQTEMGKVEEDLTSAEQNLRQRKDLLDKVKIYSPTNGIVKNVRVTTLGGVLKPGEEVMRIVPIEDDLLIEVKVKPADIAYVKPGLKVNVKIDAYDFTVFGSLSGEVTYISADTLTEDLKQNEQAYYRAQVKTNGRKFTGLSGGNIEILPGMTATVEIITGQHTVLRYLLKPIVKTMSESFGER
jgi:membrane fusion protein, adhesin transport system